MSVQLPGDLAALLERAGGTWPETDEDGVREVGRAWRDLSSRLSAVREECGSIAKKISNEHTGEGVDAFAVHWSDLDRRLETAVSLSAKTADVADGAAASTEAAKHGIVQSLEAGRAAVGQAERVQAIPVAGAAMASGVGVALRLLGQAVGLIIRTLWKFLVWVGKLIGQWLVALWKKIAELFKKITGPKGGKPKKKPNSEKLKEDFGGLKKGKNDRVRLAENEDELRGLFDKWTNGAEQMPPRGGKVPEVYKLDDGTVVQWRTGSKSGGATIDIIPQSGKPMKVHVE
ncbi:hypothetical protein [Saccharopolyspora cebuensis]|uniref:WXG100-like domain-containing protein n=1 Tax=Saccharopolyspora cebuensis TaxID=418759 RepID=UPI0031EE7524